MPLLQWQRGVLAREHPAVHHLRVHWYDHCCMVIEVVAWIDGRTGRIEGQLGGRRDGLPVGGHCYRHHRGRGCWREGNCFSATCKPT